jgi:hypothetical protein
MPRVKSPEIITGARGERTSESVTQLHGPEVVPDVAARELEPEQVHFVSSYREYAIVIATEPDRVNSSGEIVKGMNKAIRFKDFNYVTSDPIVIKKIRSLRQYGLRREVWEKYQQDQDLANRAVAMAEAAIDALPEEMQHQFAEKLAAKFNAFQLPKRVQAAKEEVA